MAKLVTCRCGHSVNTYVARGEVTHCEECGAAVGVDDTPDVVDEDPSVDVVRRRGTLARDEAGGAMPSAAVARHAPVDWKLARRAAGFAVVCALVPWVLWYAGVGERVAAWMYARFGMAWFTGAATATVAALAVAGLGAGVFSRRRGGAWRTSAAAGMLATSGYTLAFHVLPSVGMVVTDGIGAVFAAIALVLMPLVTGVVGLPLGCLGAALVRRA